MKKHYYDPDDVTEQYFDDSPEALQKNTCRSFTWSCDMETEFKLIGYTIQTWLKEHSENWLTMAEKRAGLVRYGKVPEDNVMMSGSASFVVNGQLCGYEADYQNDVHRVYSDRDISKVIEQLKTALHTDNPARKHYLQFYNERSDVAFHVRPRPNVSLDEVIIDPLMLEDIMDNTLGHLEHLDGANGLIFYGEPGTGKSLATQALASEALKRGMSACYVAGRIDFEKLDHFVRLYMGSGLLILEDIDTFTESREDRQQYGFSDFLQFMSGLFERGQKTVVIATTNHLEYLDKAVGSRPLRFNRRYDFKAPRENEMRRLLDHFFPSLESPESHVDRCLDMGFSGSHIAEIKVIVRQFTLGFRLALLAPVLR